MHAPGLWEVMVYLKLDNSLSKAVNNSEKLDEKRGFIKYNIEFIMQYTARRLENGIMEILA